MIRDHLLKDLGEVFDHCDRGVGPWPPHLIEGADRVFDAFLRPVPVSKALANNPLRLTVRHGFHLPSPSIVRWEDYLRGVAKILELRIVSFVFFSPLTVQLKEPFDFRGRKVRDFREVFTRNSKR